MRKKGCLENVHFMNVGLAAGVKKRIGQIGLINDAVGGGRDLAVGRDDKKRNE